MKDEEIARANRSGAVDFTLEAASPEELVVLGFVDEPSMLKGAPLHRSVPEPRIHARDRVLLALAARVFGSVLNATIIVRPKG